ncbi:hypothetical protein [Gallaecimonas xiamenensis]|uniref:Uncharacterized protein n=1 Tax=Gallaecimonas xiamenensis 3-C-1 TaxID=745411 RepID=K2JIS6_9GAMM|nr:hypothetical protein [Gallaecimonas xiamenensis]EKE75138.1 hypothetical protein B3C1_07676 [Gallaecimonas xiamenensis 3-C-1]
MKGYLMAFLGGALVCGAGVLLWQSLPEPGKETASLADTFSFEDSLAKTKARGLSQPQAEATEQLFRAAFGQVQTQLGISLVELACDGPRHCLAKLLVANSDEAPKAMKQLSAKLGAHGLAFNSFYTRNEGDPVSGQPLQQWVVFKQLSNEAVKQEVALKEASAPNLALPAEAS